MKFLGEIAKVDPVIARFLEVLIYIFVCDVLGAIIVWIETGQPIDWKLILLSLLTPIAAALSKRRRDLEKKNNNSQ